MSQQSKWEHLKAIYERYRQGVAAAAERHPRRVQLHLWVSWRFLLANEAAAWLIGSCVRFHFIRAVRPMGNGKILSKKEIIRRITSQ